jgi:hypothetical protein
VIAAAAVSAPAHANLLDSWHEAQAQLSEGDVVGAEEMIAELQEQAVELEVERMPAFAAALVTWAEAHPGADGETMLGLAKELDPGYPSSYFLAARWSAGEGVTVAALKETATGLIALCNYAPTQRMVAAMCVMWTVFAIAAALVTLMFVLTIRYLRGVVFDARDLGGKIFKAANAWVFAIVLLLLPLFAALGPVWLAVYLFVLCWPYMSQALRICAFLGCLALASVAPTLAWVQNDVLRSEPLMNRVSTVLDERQINFSALREFSELAVDLEEIADYHLLLGELLRMHGEPGMARTEFQKATLLDPDNAQTLVFIANLALEPILRSSSRTRRPERVCVSQPFARFRPQQEVSGGR